MEENSREKINKKRNYLTGSNFELEKKFISDGYDFVIGVDEAGRGPLAGPVVACAVVHKCHAELVSASKKIEILKQVQDDKKWQLVRDSKTLSEKQRESLYDFIHENFYVGVGICDHNVIDRMNILEATFLAMKSALSNLQKNLSSISSPYKGEEERMSFRISRKIILIDGNKNIPNLSLEQKCIVNGDKLIKCISAASIIAKVTRDRMMLEMHQKYPEYFFDKHKGYGTAVHMSALKKFGPCEIHRKSFRPVSDLL